MNRRIQTLFSLCSILLAVAMLTYGVYLIQKNTPKRVAVPVRFNPPTQPSSIDDGSKNKSDAPKRKEADRKGPMASDGKTKYIGGLGIVEPAGEAISLGSQIAGIIEKVLVAPGDQVKEGDPLLLIDSRTIRANIDVARSSLQLQEARLQELIGQIPQQKARVDAAFAIMKQSDATLSNAKKELKRAEALASSNAISEEELGQRKLNLAVAEGKLLESEARYREALSSLQLLEGERSSPTLDVQRVAVEQAKASLHREEVALAMHTIVAPRTSTVLQVKVRVGEFLPASVTANPLITLGVTDPYHVRVDIDEADIPRLKPSAQAYASLRGSPEKQVPLHFIRSEPYVIPKKSLNGGVSERVDTRVLQLIYSVEPKEIMAVPGQQVDVYIEENPAPKADT